MTWRPDDKGFGIAFIILISIAANIPLIHGYQRFTDDYDFLRAGWAEWFEGYGIWRIVGMQISKWLVLNDLLGVAAILAHAIFGCLFYLVALHIMGLYRALLLSAVVVAYPWGWHALAWGSAFDVVIATCCVWFLIHWYCARTSESTTWRDYLVVVAASALALLCYEGVLFALSLVGVLPLAFHKRSRRQLMLSGVPFAVCVVWALAYRLALPTAPIKQLEAFSVRPIVSAIYYQYTNVDVLELWLRPQLLLDALSDRVRVDDLIVFVLAAAVLVAVTVVLIQNADRTASQPFLHGRGQKTWYFVYAVLLLLGAAAIFTLSGGYSLEARKRYFLVPLFALSIALAIQIASDRGPGTPASRTLNWTHAATVSLVTVFGCATSALVMTLWLSEVSRLNALVTTLEEHSLAGPVSIEWDNSVQTLWPSLERSIGERIDGVRVLNEALAERKRDPVQIIGDAPVSVRWNKHDGVWTVERTR